MPARSNEFQKLIYLMKVNLSGEATVTESKMLIDLVAGDKVEVDVCIEGRVGDDLIKVCVECRDRSRKADKNWVHEMKAKHDRLPTNALVLASSRGFTKRAIELALSYGIKTVTLEEVQDATFPTILAQQMSLWAKTVSVSVQRVTFIVEAVNDLPEERVLVSTDQNIFDCEGVFLRTASQLVNSMMSASVARDYFLREGGPDHVWFHVEWDTLEAPPLFLQKIEPLMLRRITSVRVEGPCTFTVDGLRLRRGKIGSNQVAWGKTVLLGRDTMVVATRDSQGSEKISINISEARFADSIPSADQDHVGSETGYRR